MSTRSDIGRYLAGLLPVAEIDAMLERRQALLDAYHNGGAPTETEVREFAQALTLLAADDGELRRRLDNALAGVDKALFHARLARRDLDGTSVTDHPMTTERRR